MTKAEIKAILDRVRTWPEDRQADLARVALLIEAQQDELEPENEATKAAIAEDLLRPSKESLQATVASRRLGVMRRI